MRNTSTKRQLLILRKLAGARRLLVLQDFDELRQQRERGWKTIKRDLQSLVEDGFVDFITREGRKWYKLNRENGIFQVAEDEPETKICPACGPYPQSADRFYKNRHLRDGLSRLCKIHMLEISNKYHKTHANEINERRRLRRWRKKTNAKAELPTQ